ncbi:hypothetical protein BGZ47_006712 [Haplosporangium gracile]|nr:hypothetical protein BGZ47_006712 [Haplosporangium gracile]
MTSKLPLSVLKTEDQLFKPLVSGGLEAKAPCLPPITPQAISLYFSENIPIPLLPFVLPFSGLSHLETTTQLAYCNLLRAHLVFPLAAESIKAALTASQRASLNAIL